MLIACVAAALPGQDTRLPVPDPSSRAKSAKLIAELFQSDLTQIRSSAQEAWYAARLLRAGIDTNDDPSGRFELFEEARAAAAQAGDIQTAMEAVSQISKNYRANGLALAANTLGLAVAHMPSRDAPTALPYIDSFVSQAINADRFDLARFGVDLASDIAHKVGDGPLITEAEKFSKDVDTLKAAFDAVPTAEAKLAQNPMDPEANLTIGRYYCLYKGEWAALQPLSRGSDPVLKAIAAKDLAGASDAQEMKAIGDGWWEWAENQTGTPRQNARERAVFWYQKASPQLEGLSKLLVEHRIFEEQADHPAAAPPH